MEDREKRNTSYYITKYLQEVIEYLKQMEEVTNIVFLDRALWYFFEADPSMTEKLLITNRSDSDYVKRNILISNYIYKDQDEKVERYAYKMGYKKSQIIFQALLNYSAYLLQKNDNFYLKLIDDENEL